MYQLTQEDIDTYWMAVEGGMGWMRKWLGWWCVPNQGNGVAKYEWCNTTVGRRDFDWAHYDSRYYFKNKNAALLFVLKFGHDRN
jgi:hypothetical protein